MLGEDIGEMGLKQLQALEKQLEAALTATRQRKVVSSRPVVFHLQSCVYKYQYKINHANDIYADASYDGRNGRSSEKGKLYTNVT